METITIKGESDTPSVILDRQNNIFEISGRSMPPDTRSYDLVLNMDNLLIEDSVEVIMTYTNLRKKYLLIAAEKD